MIGRDLDRLQNEAKTVIVVGEHTGKTVRALGIIAVADRIKPDAWKAVERLSALGLTPRMITGDNEPTARAVSRRVGIESWRAGVLPEEKVAEVRKAQGNGGRVIFVGDGINDAAALMQADVGIAIGAGADVAIQSADIVLTGSRLLAVVDAYEIGRNSYRKTVQNLSLAFVFNGIGVPAAITGLVAPVWAMIAMAASVTTVLINSFAGRLFWRAKKNQHTRRTVSKEDPKLDLEKNVKAVKLHSAAIHCDSCVRYIRQTLQGVPGVRSVEGDPETKEIKIRFESQELDESGLIGEMGKIGYPVDHEEPV